MWTRLESQSKSAITPDNTILSYCVPVLHLWHGEVFYKDTTHPLPGFQTQIPSVAALNDDHYTIGPNACILIWNFYCSSVNMFTQDKCRYHFSIFKCTMHDISMKYI